MWLDSTPTPPVRALAAFRPFGSTPFANYPPLALQTQPAGAKPKKQSVPSCPTARRRQCRWNEPTLFSLNGMPRVSTIVSVGRMFWTIISPCSQGHSPTFITHGSLTPQPPRRGEAVRDEVDKQNILYKAFMVHSCWRLLRTRKGRPDANITHRSLIFFPFFPFLRILFFR